MIVKFIGASDPFYLLHGKEYYVIVIERGWDRIVDETGEDYLYPQEFFVFDKEKHYMQNK